MADLYRSEADEESIRRWCGERLNGWNVAHQTRLVDTDAGETHVVEAGAGRTAVVYLPGTNFNAATSLGLLSLLATYCRVFALDLPGQPGLSTARRPSQTPGAHAQWVSQLLHQLPLAEVDAVVLVGHSRGAHIALCADPHEIDALVLLNPAGLTRVSTGPGVLRIAVPWILRPTPTRSRAMVQLMSGSGHEPDPVLVTWFTMVATLCRTTGAPGPLPGWFTERWRAGAVVALTGDEDCFFPPDKLAPAVRRRLGKRLEVLTGVGHLSADEAPDDIVQCVLRVLPATS